MMHVYFICRTIPPASPETPDLSRLSIGLTQARDPEWTPGVLSTCSSISCEEDMGDEVLDIFNNSISELSKLSGTLVSPLKSQLNAEWGEATPEEKLECVTVATEACQAVCSVIAPYDGENLFKEMLDSSREEPLSEDLIALMTAFASAPTRNLKIQILSLYAHRYPIRKLAALHEPYGKVTHWQIRQARQHASLHGPGVPSQATNNHRVRIDQQKLDHFIEFLNRPQFYQDVAFGVRILTLDTGEKVEMPNVVRTVARSTIEEM